VVYGDTDSLFVHLPGKTMAQAFDVGRTIAQAVTDANPKDVVLQFEKVSRRKGECRDPEGSKIIVYSFLPNNF
jgi:DNA polymerase elongation subunit (family B)